MPRSPHVDGGRLLRVGLGAVDVGPGGRVQHEPERLSQFRGRKRDVPVRVAQCHSVRKLARERTAELAARARDYDALLSRSDRIGDVVLQRSATRGSFHGN